jgi:DNA-binding response OmpR family regulator
MPKVMLVEDDLTMLALLKTLLEIEGYQVVEFDPNSDIVVSIRESTPDVVLMDVYLHRMNGIQLLHEIRQHEAIQHTRVIMSSGRDVRDECISAGADDFILKPFMPDDLLSKLKILEVSEESNSGSTFNI